MNKLLLIDSDKTNRLSLRQTLNQNGYDDIIEADNSEQGLELIKENDVDCILIDLQLPGTDGVKVCKQVKSSLKTKNIQIILLVEKPEIILEDFENCFTNFLTKPFNNIELIAIIKCAINIKMGIEQLKKEMDFNKNLVENANALILVMDRSYNIINVNNRTIDTLGIERSELYNKNLFELLYHDEEYRRNVLSTYRLVTENRKKFFELETNIKNVDDEEILVRWSITFNYDDNNEIKNIVNIGHDITSTSRLQNTIELLAADLKVKNLELDHKNIELSTKNQELTELNKLKDNVLHVVSHDLRSPLNGILGYTQLLLTSQTNNTLTEKQSRIVYKIMDCGEMQLNLVNDLLDIAKLESGKMDLKLSKVNLVDVIASCIDLLESLAMNKEINLVFRKNLKIVWVTIDLPKIMQVINNLLNNAIKFTPQGGKIELSLFAKDNLVEVSIKDTGIGIEKENFQVVFKKFSQIRKHGTKDEIGTGLGLAICKNLVELHGGIITVFSEGPNKGSMFLFTLPYK